MSGTPPSVRVATPTSPALPYRGIVKLVTVTTMHPQGFFTFPYAEFSIFTQAHGDSVHDGRSGSSAAAEHSHGSIAATLHSPGRGSRERTLAAAVSCPGCTLTVSSRHAASCIHLRGQCASHDLAGHVWYMPAQLKTRVINRPWAERGEATTMATTMAQ